MVNEVFFRKSKKRREGREILDFGTKRRARRWIFLRQIELERVKKSGIFSMESEVKKRQSYDEDLTICKRSRKKPSLSHALSSVVAPRRTMIN